MPATYEKIATTTLGSAATDITFSSISSAYTDIKLVFVGFTTDAVNLQIQLDGDTGSNYSYTRLSGDGTSAASFRASSQTSVLLTQGGIASSSTPGFLTIDLFSYAGSTYKTFLSETSNDKNGSGVVNRIVGLWRSTSAIDSIKLYPVSGNISTGSTATLYGILKA
jgi:hypothetical protein